MEAADQAEANANQSSLFGGDDGSSTIEPQWHRGARLGRPPAPGGEGRARLYLSGHLFKGHEAEVRAS